MGLVEVLSVIGPFVMVITIIYLAFRSKEARARYRAEAQKELFL